MALQTNHATDSLSHHLGRLRVSNIGDAVQRFRHHVHTAKPEQPGPSFPSLGRWGLPSGFTISCIMEHATC
jgi:hypothetical protein